MLEPRIVPSSECPPRLALMDRSDGTRCRWRVAMPAKPPGSRRKLIPVAKPANPALAVTPADEERVDENWFTPENIRGWSSSLVLHGTLLLVMALWDFRPNAPPQRVLDTRLMGSATGFRRDLTPTGGLSS